MIKAYVGDFGSGKTLNMVWDLMQKIKEGRKVISNTPIKFYEENWITKRRKYYSAEFIPEGDKFQWALAHRENCICAIDEAAVYLPNIYWNKLPPEFIVKFAQNRKYRTDFWYTTQGFGHAVKRLRELTHLVLLCHSMRFFWIPDIRIKIWKWKYYKRTWKMFVARKFNPAFFYGQPSQKKWERYYKGKRILYPSQVKRVYKAYDTMFVVDTSAMMKVKGFTQPNKVIDEEGKQIYDNEQAVTITSDVTNIQSNEMDITDTEGFVRLVVPQSQPVGNVRLSN